jgi:hypothetical protein
VAHPSLSAKALMLLVVQHPRYEERRETMASIAAKVSDWISSANEEEMNEFERAFVAWNNPGIRTMQAFIDAAKKDPAIGDLLPASLKKQLELEEGHSLASEVGA